MKLKTIPSQEKLKELLNYNPNTGEFHWKVAMNSQCRCGDLAGFSDERGLFISINKIRYRAAKLAWLYVTGIWSDNIFYKDGNKSNIKWSNLIEWRLNKNEIVSQQKLKELLEYDPLTGRLVWLLDSCNTKRGEEAGTPWKRYRVLNLGGKTYYIHKLIWLYMTGYYPSRKEEIDHINRNGLDNRWENLRLATRSQNGANTKTTSKSGYKGVILTNSGKWGARIKVNKKIICLGTYNTAEEAAIAYNEAALKYFGEFAFLNDGKET